MLSLTSFFTDVEKRCQQKVSQSERKREEEANTSNGNDIVYTVDVTYQQVLCSSFEIVPKVEGGKTTEFSKKMEKTINALEVKMNNLFQDITTSTKKRGFDDIIVLARAYYNLGYIYTLKPKYLCIAKEHFERVVKLLKGKELHCKAILTIIRTHMQLSAIWLELQHLSKPYLCVVEAMKLYLNYTKDENYPDPIDVVITDTFEEVIKVEDSKNILVRLYTLTLSRLELLYLNNPTNKHEFVTHIHDLLNEQLVEALSTKIDINSKYKLSMSWAYTSAKISLYFICHGRFTEAKHHIAAADYVRIAYKLTLKTYNYPEFSVEYINYEQLHADISKLWGIYGIALLCSLKRILLQHENNKSCLANNIKSESLAKSVGLMKPLIFVDLEKELEEICEITHTYVSSLNDAKVIFKNVLKCLNTAKILTKNTFWYHVDIILHISKAYKYYAYFVESNNKIKFIKQHINFLETAVSSLVLKLTSNDYKYYKKLYLELAVTYSTLLNMTHEEFNERKEVTDEMRKEIKHLIKSILDNYNLYMKET